MKFEIFLSRIKYFLIFQKIMYFYSQNKNYIYVVYIATTISK